MLTKTLFNKQDLQFVNRKVKCNETTIYVFALTQCSTYRNSKLKFLNNVQKKLQLKKKKKGEKWRNNENFTNKKST